MVASCGNRRDVAGHNLLGLVGSIGVVESAVAQLAIEVVAHGPQAAVALEKQAVPATCGNRRDVAGHNLLRDVRVVDCAVAQLAIFVVAHGPQAAVALEKQAVDAPVRIRFTQLSCGNRRDVAGHNLLGDIDVVGCAVAQLPK